MKPMNSETFGWNIPRKHVLFFHEFLDIVRVSPRMMIGRIPHGPHILLTCDLGISLWLFVT